MSRLISLFAASAAALTLVVVPTKPVAAQPSPPDPAFAEVYHAITVGDLDGLRKLLKTGVALEKVNWLGVTPLQWASMMGNEAAVELLLENRADIKADCIFGSSLEFALMSPNPKLAAILLARGAVPSTQRVDKITALMLAADQGLTDSIARLLAANVAIGAVDATGATALHYASRRGHAGSVRALLAAGAPVDAKDSFGRTPLLEAAQTGQTDVVKQLLARGANGNGVDRNGNTALHLAARYGGVVETVRALKSAGADMSARDRTGKTAAQWATRRGFTDIVAVLSAKTPVAPTATPIASRARVAVSRSLPLIERTTGNFSKVMACASCHHQGLGLATTGLAKRLGFATDGTLAREQSALVTREFTSALPQLRGILSQPQLYKVIPTVDVSEYNPGATTTLFGLVEHAAKPTEATDAMATVLARQQTDDGAWRFYLHREPLQSSPFLTTALAVRALDRFVPKALAAEYAGRRAKARAWLIATPAVTNEDMTWRLIGLRFAGAPEPQILAAKAALVAARRNDGGWAQFPKATTQGAAFSRSDAYATGQALYALATAGKMATTDPVYRRGAEYLLRTQDDDGSWFVSKRAIPANNFFDTGFPHGESQYISYSATCWATMALALAADRPKITARR